MAEGNGGWAEQECYACWSILGAWLCHVSATNSFDSDQPLQPQPIPIVHSLCPQVGIIVQIVKDVLR